jgi:type IX secretion system PorP/SprF family membrane protein
MYRLKLIMLGAILLLCYSAVAQQDPQFSQYFHNQLAFNPAYAGSNDMICANAIYKNQWTGFGDGAPNTTGVSIHSPIKPFGLSSGVGMSIQNDAFGFNSDLGLGLSYAVRFNITGVGTLAVGLNGGFINNSIDPQWNASNTSDPSIPQTKESAMNFDMGFGVFFRSQDMYFGVSSTHLNEPNFNKAVSPSTYKRHFYLTGGYDLALPSSNWEFSPSVLVGTNGSIHRYALTSVMTYNKKVWGGLQYRIGDAVSAIVGFELFNGMRLSYAYDFSTTEISRYNNGSHEFMVGYCFTLRKETPPQQYRSIRFL